MCLFRKRGRILFYVISLIFLGGFSLEATEPVSARPLLSQVAFQEGERLVYDIAYLGAKTGVAIFEIKDKVQFNGRAIYPILLTAQSNDLVSLFYRVDDRVETHMDAEGLYTHYLNVKQHQGRKKRNKTINFDQIQHQAVQFKNNKTETFEIPPAVQDSLSSLYFFRSRELPKVGTSTYIDVHESEKNWKLELRALKREEVKTPVGIFQTIKVQALVRYEGLFMDKGDVFIWFSDDVKRIPVLIKTRIKIGSVTATLFSRRDRMIREARYSPHLGLT